MRLTSVLQRHEIEVWGGNDASQEAEEMFFNSVWGMEKGGQRVSRMVEKVPNAAFDVYAFALFADFVQGFKDI